jgi:hypothetical protein
MVETDLYLLIKSFLEGLGYTVKAEVKDCDVVALRPGSEPVIVELKTGLNLQLFYQAMDRLAVSDLVYVAIPRPKRGVPLEAVKLCRRIGIGLLVVSASGSVEAVADPLPYAPRKNKQRLTKLLGEFNKRDGDHNLGGSSGRKIMTAYRQDAIKCAKHLATHGPASPKSIKAATQVDRAASILRDNHYGWFEKITRGVYGVTKDGAAGVGQDVLSTN